MKPNNFQNNKPEPEEILAKIKEKLKNQKIISKIKDKDLTIILGDTGSGKSTLINYLLGSKLTEKKINEKMYPIIDLEEGEKEYTKIGHSFKSETEGFSIHSNGNLNLLDSQGFFDCRGIEFQIHFSFLLNEIFQNCKSLRFIFVIDYEKFLVSRMAGVKKNFNFIEKLFSHKKFFHRYKNSIMILVTKQNLKDKIDKIKDIFLNSGNDTQKFLHDRIFFYDPLNFNKKGVLNREEFLEELSFMDLIKEKVLVVPFSDEEKLFFKTFFEIRKNRLVKKSHNDKYLELMIIYENFQFFEKIQIIFLKKLFEDFHEILTPCLERLEKTFLECCNSTKFKAAKIYLKILKTFLEIKQLTTHDYKYLKNSLIKQKDLFSKYQITLENKKKSKIQENKMILGLKSKIQIKNNEKNKKIKNLYDFLMKKLEKYERDIINQIKKINKKILKKEKEEKFLKEDEKKKILDD